MAPEQPNRPQRIAAVLFDLGGTLASYYRKEEFRPVLERAVAGVMRELERQGVRTVSYEQAMQSAVAANREAEDYRVTPLAGRLERIFELSAHAGASLGPLLCERFLEPIFELGRVYDDAVPALEALRAHGYRTAIVSNSPWGSAGEPWRRELARLGLLGRVDAAVLCSDAGFRKPAPQIFRLAAERLDVTCGECLFVGDDLEWDMAGSAAAGMRSLLVDREGYHAAYSGPRVADLRRVIDHCR